MATVRNFLVYVLINLLVLPPAAMAQGGIVPDAAAAAGKRPGMDTAANGAPVVNITAPNASGLSHNQYSDFNVQKQGAILNNSAKDAQSQLGGIVLGNGNLAASGSAKTILNEVTSSNRSHIQGYIEVNGQRADVILANPNGITINGGGFINTGRATVTTGKPEFEPAGALRSFNVRQGDVRIEGDGINAGNLTAFDIVSRAAEINANIYANELNIITGQNSYDPATGIATPLADDNSAKPMIAIDSSSLGGMYAGRITLTSNEKGVGVNLQGVVQSVNDMEITADGRLALRAAKAGGSMTLASKNDIAVAEAAIADKNLTASAKNIALNYAALVAGNKLEIQVKDNFTAANDAEVGAKNVTVKAATLEIRSGAKVQGDSVSLQAQNLAFNKGSVATGDSLELKSSGKIAVGNDSLLASKNSLQIQAGEVTVDGGGNLESGTLNIQADNNITVASDGSVLASDSASFTSANLANSGLIYAGNKLSFNINNKLSNLNGADILAGGDIHFGGLTPGSRMSMLHNQASSIESLDGSIGVYADTMFNDGGAPATRRVNDGYDYKIVGWVGDRDSLDYDDDNNRYRIADFGGDTEFKISYDSRDEPIIQIKNPDDGSWTPLFNLQLPYAIYDNPEIPYYAYGADGKKNYMAWRYYLLKSPDAVAAYVKQQYALYGIPAQLAGDHEGLQEWKEYSYDELLTPASPARFMAGRNITFDVSALTNNYSTISAGGDVNITADNFSNRGLELSRYTNIERAFLSTGSSGTRKIAAIDKLYYNYAELLSSIPAVISAGGSVNIDASVQFDNSVVKSGEQYSGASAGIPGFSGFPATGGWQNNSQWMPQINLGGLFQPSTAPGHKYLIETNPKLTSMGTFYGSEYFLNKIGYNLAQEQNRLLGDAFFETRLVRDQILAQSGQRYLFDGITSDADTMLRLMDNAAVEQSGLSLAVGVSLTPEQIAGLTKDIIWLEEQEYNGQIVLVPRLYLCDATKAELAVRGSNINGTDVSIASADLTNQGGISGKNVVLAASNDVLNKGGSINASNTLIVNADGSIRNQSGSLGGGDITLAAGKDVSFETVVDQQKSGSYGNRPTVHQVASVNATGNLNVLAGNNITLAGADVKAGGTASFDAAENVVIASQSVTQAGGGKNSNFSHTSQIGSSVNVGNLSVTAGDNIAVVGSNVNAKGSAALSAGNDITVMAAREESHIYLHDKKNGGTFGSKSEKTVKKDSTTAVGSGITSGGNLAINAGNALTVGGSNLMAGTAGQGSGNLNITAGGEVLVATVTEDTYNYNKNSSKSMLSSSSKRNESGSTTNVGSLLAGDNVNIQSGKSIKLSGSDMLAREDINLSAGGDVLIAAAQDSSFKDSKKSKSGFGVFTGGGSLDVYRSEKTKNNRATTTSVGSELSAGGNINIAASNDITGIGSRLNAAGDVNLAAGRDVNILADTSSDFSSSSKKTKAVGIQVSSSKDTIGIYDSFTATAGYRSKTTKEENSLTWNVGSGVSAGGALNVTANDNINILGSNLQSGGAMRLDGDNINVMSGFDTTYTEKYVKDMQYGLRLDARQSLTQGTKDIANSVYDSFQANNKKEAYNAERFQSPTANARTSINYNDQITVNTSSQSKAVASSLKSGDKMDLAARQDINLVGADVSASGKLSLSAGNNVNVTAAEEVGVTTYDKTRRSISNPMAEQYKGKQSERAVTVTNVGSTLAGNEVSISAGNNIGIKGSTIAANNGIDLTAGNDITIGAAQDKAHKLTKAEEYGIDLSNPMFVAGTKKTESATTVDVGSNLVSGGNITVNAGSDIGMKASGLYAKGDVNLNAGGDVTIAAGEARHEEKVRTSHAGYSDTTKATEETISTFAGVNYTYLKKDAVESAAIASNVAAGGNININARDGDVTVRGSNLDSYKDINVSAGQDIKFEVADQITKLDEHGVYAQVGALGEGEQKITGLIRKAVDQTESALKKIRDVDEMDSAGDAWDLVSAVKDGKKAIENVYELKDGFGVSFKVGAKIGVENVEKTKDSNNELASTAKAGRDINLDAVRDVNMRGTQLSAENDVNIDAGRNLDIHASLNKQKEYERKTDGSLFAGVSGQYGTGGTAVGFRGEIGAGYGSTEIDNKIYNNAQITAGHGLNVTTGGDAKIIGGNLKGDEVDMNIGGDLTLASLQNQKKTSTTKSGASMGFTFGFGAAGGPASSDSPSDESQQNSNSTPSLSNSGSSEKDKDKNENSSDENKELGFDRGVTKVNFEYSDYESDFVGKQSTIEGKSKVDIYVDGNTHLKGSMINSDSGNLKLDTNTLSYKNITSTERGWKLGAGVENPGVSKKKYNDVLVDTREKKKEENQEPKKEEPVEGSGLSGWVYDKSEQLVEKLEPVDNYLKNIRTKPTNLMGGYSEKEQYAKATIGAGEIVIRSNPDLDISKLNRDPKKSLEVKDMPILWMDSDTVRGFVEDIKIKDPTGTIRDGIDVVKGTRDTSKDIVKAGGVKEYIRDNAKKGKDKAFGWVK